MAQPRFSAGTDAASVTPALKALLTSDGGRWTLAKDGAALERQFKFKTFAKTWVWHSNVYNTTFVRWTTHNPAGLSDKDIDMAAQCDTLAAQLGELPPEPVPEAAVEAEGQSCAIRGLADRAAGAAGDCCTPKSK
ncbi:uncharacterized protein NECHADRAFT_76536 [Fusarium vanettenii 77-13-4]|uniref:4a-hydroxytetrahydrobiopterin dehydratase n=1 Tax=Fusarium vanettenii (strain ATCC MYA-4622 / CBS 123669 / FGSC 9596 / NRRL 45880 / 77-13-4) TaxID=660122 RepID=C7Z4I7_FUSV7|nr:uncharacterized protein NECHADRAFT_76536 [Fusarium vanettenii 77-13-4]EEU40930.1 hypothetical protein NECHADRAFT_76536 [Fusarium vanettenii 77-13-4]